MVKQCCTYFQYIDGWTRIDMFESLDLFTFGPSSEVQSHLYRFQKCHGRMHAWVWHFRSTDCSMLALRFTCKKKRNSLRMCSTLQKKREKSNLRGSLELYTTYAITYTYIYIYKYVCTSFFVQPGVVAIQRLGNFYGSPWARTPKWNPSRAAIRPPPHMRRIRPYFRRSAEQAAGSQIRILSGQSLHSYGKSPCFMGN